MSRPLRIEFPGAVDHVTSRGDRREPIYRDDEDRTTHLEVINQAMDRFHAQVLTCCQMGNHHHLMPHTRQANLSRLMRHVNGAYTQAFNRLPPSLLWVTCGNVTNERLRALFAATLPAALIRLEAAISIIEIGSAAGS